MSQDRPAGTEDRARGEVPLFPLNTVLYPGGPLPLQIFEPRYLDMVARCVREQARFGVCAIESGDEAGGPATPHRIGTFARIADWTQYDNGLLGVTVIGEERFEILSTRVGAGRLLIGTVRALPAEPAAPLPAHFAALGRIVETLVERTGPLYGFTSALPHDASWVGYRLAEALDIPLPRKQAFLELEDPLARLDELEVIVQELADQG